MENHPEHDRIVIVYCEDYTIPMLAKYWVLDGWCVFVTADSDYDKYVATNGDTWDYQVISGTVIKWQYLPENWNIIG